jgi:hypothetical protein
VGLGLLTGSLTLLAGIALTFLVYYHFVIRHEERRLADLFGPAFDAYRTRVPRLFPRRLRPDESAAELAVQVGSFMRSLRDTRMFLWAFFAMELSEAFASGYGIHLPKLCLLA